MRIAIWLGGTRSIGAHIPSPGPTSTVPVHRPFRSPTGSSTGCWHARAGVGAGENRGLTPPPGRLSPSQPEMGPTPVPLGVESGPSPNGTLHVRIIRIPYIREYVF